MIHIFDYLGSPFFSIKQVTRPVIGGICLICLILGIFLCLIVLSGLDCAVE